MLALCHSLLPFRGYSGAADHPTGSLLMSRRRRRCCRRRRRRGRLLATSHEEPPDWYLPTFINVSLNSEFSSILDVVMNSSSTTAAIVRVGRHLNHMRHFLIPIDDS